MEYTKIKNATIAFPIFALHGTASSGQQWHHLSKDNIGIRNVVMPDIPGYGDALAGHGTGLTARLEPLLKQFLAEDWPMHVVGHSFGGALALRLAEIYPERCLSVTIYEPTSLEIFRNVSDDKSIKLLNNIKFLASKVTSSSPMMAMSLFIDFWMGHGQWQSLHTSAQQHLSKYATIAAKDFKDGLYEAKFSSNHPLYSGPVKLMHGQKTMEIAKHICQLLANKLPNASVLQVSDLGHMGPIQNPAKINKHIMQHIKDTESLL